MLVHSAARQCFTFSLLSAVCIPAFAGGDFDIGGVKGKWALQASAGTAMRLQNPHKDLLFVGDVPGGSNRSSVADDGNLNYGSGDIVSTVIKAVGDISLSKDDYTFFIRGYTWYDYTMDDKRVPHGHYANGYHANGRLNDSHFDREARFKGADILDVWVAGKFQINDRPLEVKFGRQNILWGRSLFARASISSLNAINLPALHRPGADPKEYLLPATALHLDYKPTDDLQLRAFYQFEWRNTISDGCGTFYSNLDNTATGCDATFLSSQVMPSKEAFDKVAYLKRENDRKPRNMGQFGLKADYRIAAIDTHVGAYFINYHSHLPIYSLRRARADNGAHFIPGDPHGGNATYYFEYPDDIRIFGLTAMKTFNTFNLAANISYVPDFPLQINTSDITSSVLGGKTPSSSYTDSFGPGQRVSGYREVDLTRAEFTATKVLPGLFGSRQITLSAEIAAETISGMPSTIRFRRHTNFGVGPDHEGGYTTDFSWGYSVAARATYNNVFDIPLTVSPAVTFRHGVKGYSSDDAFQEDQRSLGAGVTFEYGRFKTVLDYARYSDTRYSVVRDRDLLSLSTTMTF